MFDPLNSCNIFTLNPPLIQSDVSCRQRIYNSGVILDDLPFALMPFSLGLTAFPVMSLKAESYMTAGNIPK